MEKVHYDPSEITPPSKPHANVNIKSSVSKSSEPYSVKIGKNHITTRISAKSSLIGQMSHTTHSSSSLSSEFHLDKSSPSPSFCSSTTPLSRNTNMASSRIDDNNSVSKPSYNNLTEATKAKQRNMYHRTQSRPEDESKFLRNTNNFW
ncbi:hypothetical protein POM88_032081 [Heracleum sosnowskyi]|uniref:Uncharacterized protein n=1 Tax=Heracleum sosnowskyi TaxID=360622 RepID=A0AAD8MKX6_9APIA|nr:hypothetical protein POM88_032081 [Heracleum sosnowskyi]